ncbi:MAG: hypothetical protein R2788_27070 [Saprospiraceae bacterium]
MLFTKKHLFLILAIFYILPLFGQEKQTVVKLAANVFRGGAADNPNFFNNEIDNSFTDLFSAGFILFNNDKFRYQEINLSRVSHNKEKVNSNEISQTVLALKYELGWQGKELNDYLKLRFGVAMELFYGKNDLNPTTLQGFPIKQSVVGAMLAFSSHLDIILTEHLFIDFNPSIVLPAYYFEENERLNPTLPKRAQTQSSFGLDLGGVLLQIGVGYKW